MIPFIKGIFSRKPQRAADRNMPRHIGRVIPISPIPQATRDPTRDPLSLVIRSLVANEFAKINQRFEDNDAMVNRLADRIVKQEFYASHVERLSHEVTKVKAVTARLKKKGAVVETPETDASSTLVFNHLTPPVFVGENFRCKIKGVVSVVFAGTETPVLTIHDADSPKKIQGTNLRSELERQDIFPGDRIEVTFFNDDYIEIAVLERAKRKKKPA